MLPKLHVAIADQSLGMFSCGFIVIANNIYGFNEMAITAKNVCSVVRHNCPPRLEVLTFPTALNRRRMLRFLVANLARNGKASRII
jgi:hypothetical protein